MSDRTLWYDKSGTPMTMKQAASVFKDPVYKRVGSDTVTCAGRSWWVSTVWLGIDHGWGDGPPVIFETMIFAQQSLTDPDEDQREQETTRYTTLADAEAGHAKTVRDLTTWAEHTHGATATTATGGPS